jgi:iron complex transport system permease protein
VSRSNDTVSPARAFRLGLRRRTVVVSAVALLLVFCCFVISLLLGAAALTPAEVLDGLTGQGSQVVQFVVWDLRMPRAVAAIAVGLCLGASGAIFQAVVHNPLASPDIVGVTSGAGTAGVLGVLVFGLSGLALSFTVVLGGVTAAVLVASLAWRRGLQSTRLVLVGIGIAAVAVAFTSYLLTRTEVRDASVAYTWLVGSLSASAWPVVGWTCVLAFLAFVALQPQLRGLRALELGDATAAGLGFRVERTRILVLLTAVVLATVAVGAGGPIGFVALMAPQIARRMVGRTSLSLTAAAAAGALLVSASDLIAQYVVPSASLPVGVVTGAIGAPYLAWLLGSNGRRTKGPQA